MDGFSVLFHQVSYGTVGLSTLQSRAFAGQIEEHVRLLPAGIDRSGAATAGTWCSRPELDSRYRPCRWPSQMPRLRHLCGREQAHPYRRRRPGADGRCVRQAATAREAVPRASCTCSPETLAQVRVRRPRRRAASPVAELAGVMAAKRTADLIPLCHPLALTKVEVTGRDDELARLRSSPRSAPRPHRRRDGGADRGLRRLPDPLRHAQGDRPDDDDHRHCRHPKTGGRSGDWHRG